jgi:hypothetical protein
LIDNNLSLLNLLRIILHLSSKSFISSFNENSISKKSLTVSIITETGISGISLCNLNQVIFAALPQDDYILQNNQQSFVESIFFDFDRVTQE